MKTLQHNTQLIEDYIEGKLSAGERLLFEAKLILYPVLRSDLYYQKKAHQMVKMYNRKKLKEELEMLHHHIFNDPVNSTFQQGIYNLFNA